MGKILGFGLPYRGALAFSYLGLFMYLQLRLGKVLGICFVTTWGSLGLLSRPGRERRKREKRWEGGGGNMVSLVFYSPPGGREKRKRVCLGVLSSCAVFFSCRDIL